LLTSIWLASLLVSEKTVAKSNTQQRQPLAHILRRPAVLAFFAVSFFLQLSHGPYYTFFSIYLEAQSYSKSSIGVFWSLGVIAEVLLFLGMHRVLAAYSLRNIVLWSLALSCLRWLLIAYFVEYPAVLFLAQCLHAASFGSYHAAGIEIIRRSFTGHQGQGMALYSGVSFGLGGAAGAVLSGWAWDFSSVLCFTMAAVAAAIGFAIGWRHLRLPANEEARV
jgi:PPP family 3-phenylpropionic acid transporter